MRVVQREVQLSARPRGFHLVTREILAAMPEIRGITAGVLHVFIRHTSASLTLNENADPDVRADFESWFSRTVRDGDPAFTHVIEGPDDMAAHIKASLLGASVSVPITGGRPNVGTWQGIYLCEHRDHGGPRSLVLTLTGA